MLASSAQADFYIETKLDGSHVHSTAVCLTTLRSCQIHKIGSEYSIFSRHGTDRPDYVSVLRPHLDAALRCHSCSERLVACARQALSLTHSVESTVIDGELMAYDSTEGTFVSFGGNRGAAIAQQEDASSTLQ